MKFLTNMKQKLKVKLTVLFILTLCTTPSFADKSCFYENGKVRDTMYVNSPEGLRIRQQPSFSGKKLCTIPNMIQVKVVAIGNEVTIDGIKAPWVEILVPRYEWKGDEPEYGWVFGGYLSDSREQWKLPLELRLQIYNFYSMIDFCAEGFNSKTFSFNYNVHSYDRKFKVHYFGKWKVDKDTVLFDGTHQIFSENGLIWEEESYKAELQIDACDITQLKVFPLVGACEVEMGYGYKSLLSMSEIEELQNQTEDLVSGYFVEEDDARKIDFTKPYIYYQAFSDCADERDSNYNPLICLSGEYSKKYTYYVPRLIEAGIDPRNSDYEKQYHDYLDPIMAEHQKKADAME